MQMIHNEYGTIGPRAAYHQTVASDVTPLRSRKGGKRTEAAQQVAHLLNDMAGQPFIALIFDGDALRVYAKGLDPSKTKAVERFLAEMGITAE